MGEQRELGDIVVCEEKRREQRVTFINNSHAGVCSNAARRWCGYRRGAKASERVFFGVPWVVVGALVGISW